MLTEATQRGHEEEEAGTQPPCSLRYIYIPSRILCTNQTQAKHQQDSNHPPGSPGSVAHHQAAGCSIRIDSISSNGGAGQGEQQDQGHRAAAAAAQEVEEAGGGARWRGQGQKRRRRRRAQGVLRGVRGRGDAAVRDPHRVPGPLGVRGAAPGGGGGVRVPAPGRAPDPLRRRLLRGHPQARRRREEGRRRRRHVRLLLLLRDGDLVQMKPGL